MTASSKTHNAIDAICIGTIVNTHNAIATDAICIGTIVNTQNATDAICIGTMAASSINT
jgi:hypothetical protein